MSTRLLVCISQTVTCPEESRMGCVARQTIDPFIKRKASLIAPHFFLVITIRMDYNLMVKP